MPPSPHPPAAASASGGIANYVATVAFNVSRIPVNGKRPLSLSLSLPEANVGAVVRAIGPTADDLLPDFVKNVNLPSLSLSTWDKVTGTGNRTNLTSEFSCPHTGWRTIIIPCSL